MRPVVKTGLVVAGYVAAFAIAAAVVAIYVAVTNSPARQSSSGMYAFGDTVVFLAVFAIAALPATGAALFFLRPCSSLWLVLSVVAPVTAVTGLVALIVYAAVQTTHAQSVLNAWSGISVKDFCSAVLCSGVPSLRIVCPESLRAHGASHLDRM